MKKWLLIFLSFPAFAFAQTDRMDAESAYTGRQEKLIELASTLGELHHIRQICLGRSNRQNADLWRERMKELVTLEEPVAVTRQKMIERFNKSFGEAEKNWLACSAEALARQSALGEMGRSLAIALSDPLGQNNADDFTNGLGVPTLENGIRVYRPTDE